MAIKKLEYFSSGALTNWIIYGKKISNFLKWRLVAAAIVFLIFRGVSYGIVNPGGSSRTSHSFLNIININKAYIEVNYLEVRVNPPDGTYINAACYQLNENGQDTKIHHQNFTKYGVFKWKVNKGIYFCDALFGRIDKPPSLSTKDFAVYGDIVPEKSSVWLVDFHGRRRIEEKEIVTNDFIGRWHEYPSFD